MFGGGYFEAAPISCLPETDPLGGIPACVCPPSLSLPPLSLAATSTRQLLTEGFFPLSFLLCLLHGVFEGRLVPFPLLFIFNRLFFCQRASMDIYFILRVVAIEASAFSCCSVGSCFGHWRILRLPSMLPKDLPFLSFPSVLHTLSILAPQNVPAHLVLFLPRSWKQPCLREIAILFHWKMIFVV